MRPEEVFGDRCLGDDTYKNLEITYNKLKHKDCVFLIWGDRTKCIIIEKDKDSYYCIFGSGQKFDVKYSLEWMPVKDVWEYINIKGKEVNPTIIDKEAYKRFKEYLVLEGI